MQTEQPTTEPTSTEPEKNQIAIIAQPIMASIADVQENKEKLTKLVVEYKDTVFKDLNDKEGIKLVKTGYSEVRQARLTVDKLGKNFKSLMKQVIEHGESQIGELLDIVSPVEKALKAEKERFDDLTEEAKQEELRVLEEKKQARISKVFELGLKFNGTTYSIGELNITPIQIIQYSEAQFEGFIAQATVEYEAVQLKLAEAETARLAEVERIRIANEKADEERRKQKELDDAKLAEQQAELDEINRERDLMRFERTESRVDTLKAKGFTGDLKERIMRYGDFSIKAGFIVEAKKDAWEIRMIEADLYIHEANKPKETPIELVVSPAILSKSESLLMGVPHISTAPLDTVTPAEKEAILEEAFGVEEVTQTITLTFTKDQPYIDAKMGSSNILRVYSEAFVDIVNNSLTGGMVAKASGSLGDLLFIAISNK